MLVALDRPASGTSICSDNADVTDLPFLFPSAGYKTRIDPEFVGFSDRFTRGDPFGAV